MEQHRTLRKKKNRHRPKQQKPTELGSQLIKLEFERIPCSFCHQTIADLPSAVAYGPSGVPVHLECAITYLHETEKLLEGESLTYLGAGHFAIVKRGPPLEIMRKIAFENKDSTPEWKLELNRKALALLPSFTLAQSVGE